MTEEQFFSFCQENETLRLERNSNGEIIVMEPTGSETGSFNLSITAQLYAWNQKKKWVLSLIPIQGLPYRIVLSDLLMEPL